MIVNAQARFLMIQADFAYISKEKYTKFTNNRNHEKIGAMAAIVLSVTISSHC
jgi:hypothetical protein